jgi:voltage-gated potassium channel
MPAAEPAKRPLRAVLNEVIFGYETRAGRLFDVLLIVLILCSVLAVLLDSVAEISARYHTQLYALEWLFTLLFTAEYGLRLYSTDSVRRYSLSFFGLVDLGSILPTYLSLIVPSASFLLVIRVLRVLRIFRILKLLRYLSEANLLMRALAQSRRKIFIFLFGVLTLNIIFGALMFLVEGPANGFTSIPASMYWAIVTITTVGYGDISPQTGFGRVIASLAMVTGYAIIAIPTGIVSSELINEFQLHRRDEDRDYALICKACQRRGHDRDAQHCKQCGAKLPD